MIITSVRRARLIAAALVAALSVSMLAVSPPVSAGADTTGSLTTPGGTLVVPAGSGGFTTGGGGNLYVPPPGVPSWEEDPQGVWYRFRGVESSEPEFNWTDKRLAETLFYPGQLPNFAAPRASRSLVVDESWKTIGGDKVRRNNAFSAASNAFAGTAAGANTHPGVESYGMSGVGICPRAWVVGSRVSESNWATERYEIAHAQRLTKDEQCSTNFSEDVTQLISCRPAGGDQTLALGFIYNNEITGYAPDYQNLIIWGNKRFNYRGRQSPIEFGTNPGFWDELKFSGEQLNCVPISAPDKQVTVAVGSTVDIDILDAASVCEMSCDLDTGSIVEEFRGTSLAGLESSNADGRITVRGTETGVVDIPFTIKQSNNVEAQATLKIEVTPGQPEPTDKSVTIRKGRSGFVNLWSPSQCPDGYTCELDVPAFVASFTASLPANISTQALPCLSDQTGACNDDAAPDGRIYVHASSWEGTLKVPFTVITTAGGRSGTAMLTINVVSSPPTPTDKTLALQTGDARIVDLWSSSDCPAGYVCELDVEDFVAAVAALNQNVACVDGFDAGGCALDAAAALDDRAAFANGIAVIRAVNPGELRVPFAVTNEFGDTGRATLVVTVTEEEIPQVGCPPGDCDPTVGGPVVTGEVEVTRPPVGRVGGLYQLTTFEASLVDVSFSDCPTGWVCTPELPGATGTGSRGFSLAPPSEFSAAATVGLSGPYRTCGDPSRCDLPASTNSAPVAFGSDSEIEFSFYRATSTADPYEIDVAASGRFKIVRWRFNDSCSSSGQCTALLVVTNPIALPEVPLTARLTSADTSLIVIGPRLN